MKKIMFGMVIGLAVPKINQYYRYKKFSKENPDDPQTIKVREDVDRAKKSFWAAVNETKNAWVRAKDETKFNDIIRDIDN